MTKFLLLALLLLMITPLMTAGQTLDEDHPWCVSVWYYPAAQYPGAYDSLMANRDIIDEVNPFWYSLTPDGAFRLNPDAEDADQLAAWREAGLKIVPSIYNVISAIIEDETTRAAHIQAITELVTGMNYDGIDIDYEAFPVRSRDAFSTFIEDLSAALHEDGRELSVTVHAKTDDAGTWTGPAAQDWVRLSLAADVFRIMTYDYTGQNMPPGPIAPVGWVEDVLAYAATITDLGKVRMGLPYYGYSWQRGTPPAQGITWSSIQNWVDNLNLEFQRDPADMEAYVDFKITGLPRQTVYIADPVSLAFKLERIAALYPNLGGVSIWGIGGEHPGLWDVLRDDISGCQPAAD